MYGNGPPPKLGKDLTALKQRMASAAALREADADVVDPHLGVSSHDLSRPCSADTMTLSRTAVEGLQRISDQFDELCTIIRLHDDGDRPADFAERLREILANKRTADHDFTRMDGANAVLAIIDREGWGLAGIRQNLDKIREEVECNWPPIREVDVERIAGMFGLPRSPADEPAIAWLERAVRWGALRASHERDDQHLERLRRPRGAHERRPRIFTFANGCEIDVDRYLGLDATATRDGGTRPSITFQLGHGGFLRVAFESEQQRADELARMRAFRDGVA